MYQHSMYHMYILQKTVHISLFMFSTGQYPVYPLASTSSAKFGLCSVVVELYNATYIITVELEWYGFGLRLWSDMVNIVFNGVVCRSCTLDIAIGAVGMRC